MFVFSFNFSRSHLKIGLQNLFEFSLQQNVKFGGTHVDLFGLDKKLSGSTKDLKHRFFAYLTHLHCNDT